MTAEKTELHEIKRGDGKIVVKVTYTPRTGKPVGLYRLKMEVQSAEGCSSKVFIYQRATVGAPMEDGSPRDEFIGVADELDEYEIPVDVPDMTNNIPYYRTDSVELLFRNSDQMYEACQQLIVSLAIV